MVRLIDADALRREVQQITFHGNGGILTVMAINKAPTVDAIPFEWIEKNYPPTLSTRMIERWKEEE